MSGFTSPIVGGQGTILIPAIQSPNFNLVAQTGWSIQKNGNAYFFNITASGSITASSFVGTDFFINSLGEFFYSGTPAAGNLIASIAPTSGANDGHGNPYNEGISVYGSNNAVINMSDNSGSPGIFLRAASVSHITTNAEIFTFADNAGLANEIQCIVMSSGKESGHADAAIQLFSASADNTVSPVAIIEFGGTIFCYITSTGIVLPGNPTPAFNFGNACIFASTNGTLQVVDGVDGQVYGTERRTVVTGSNQPITSTTFGTVLTTTISGTTTGTRAYHIHAQVTINPNQANGGILFAWGASGVSSSRIDVMFYDSPATGNPPENYSSLAPNTSVNTTFTMAAGQQYVMVLDGIVVMNVNIGSTFALQFAEAIAGDAFTVLQGSYIEAMPV